MASTVCGTFDLMGLLLRNRLAPKREFLEAYSAAIQILYNNQAMQDYLAFYRAKKANGTGSDLIGCTRKRSVSPHSTPFLKLGRLRPDYGSIDSAGELGITEAAT
jgi:hypothetical protein